MNEIKKIGQLYSTQKIKETIKQPVNSSTIFSTMLNEQIEKNYIKLSMHAKERLEERNLSLSVENIEQLNRAVELAEKKGAKDSLILLNDLAFIVNIKNKTIITAIDKENMNDHVFTQIDSAIILN